MSWRSGTLRRRPPTVETQAAIQISWPVTRLNWAPMGLGAVVRLFTLAGRAPSGTAEGGSVPRRVRGDHCNGYADACRPDGDGAAASKGRTKEQGAVIGPHPLDRRRSGHRGRGGPVHLVPRAPRTAVGARRGGRDAA